MTMPAPRKIDVEEVVALRAAGHGIRAIARALGVAPSSISRILRRPEVAERVERERERLAASAQPSEGGRSPSAEGENGRSTAPREALWLLVRSGSWGFGSRRGEKVVMRSFPAGLYLDVDEEVVAFVRKAKSAQLLLGTGAPPASA
jgi:hypothetical protein